MWTRTDVETRRGKSKKRSTKEKENEHSKRSNPLARRVLSLLPLVKKQSLSASTALHTLLRAEFPVASISNGGKNHCAFLVPSLILLRRRRRERGVWVDRGYLAESKELGKGEFRGEKVEREEGKEEDEVWWQGGSSEHCKGRLSSHQE
jgi:hypothetical protein